jgi:hypothetical protein
VAEDLMAIGVIEAQTSTQQMRALPASAGFADTIRHLAGPQMRYVQVVKYRSTADGRWWTSDQLRSRSDSATKEILAVSINRIDWLIAAIEAGATGSTGMALAELPAGFAQ